MDLILDFTHTYPEEWVKAHGEMVRIDCADLTGTDMYCTRESEAELEKRIADYPLRGIHFLDSGNYHYMTGLFAKRIKEPYYLVFLDHHTDCQPTMIPELLSCGAWAKRVLEEDSFLQKMILIGPAQGAIDEIDTANKEKLVTISREELDAAESGLKTLVMGKFPSDAVNFPLYISVDKDVLDAAYARTNWDQGTMSLKELKEILGLIQDWCRGRDSEILGMDLCGELPEREASFGEAMQAREINTRTNDELYLYCRQLLGKEPSDETGNR